MIFFDHGGGGTLSALNDTEVLAGKPGTAGLEIMVYLGILVTRKFLASQKILTEVTTILS